MSVFWYQVYQARLWERMLTSRGLPSDSTCVLKAEPGKLDIKRREPTLKGQHWGSPWHLLAPISYNCYSNTFTLIPSDDDKILPTCTQSCVTREIHMKQLLMDSIFCFSFDRPVTDNCPILVLKKSTRLKKYYQRLRAVPTWFRPRCKWFKSILIFNEYQKRHIRSAWTPIVSNQRVCCLNQRTMGF